MFSTKTKVSCYKSEINKSVMLHAFFKKQRYRFTVIIPGTGNGERGTGNGSLGTSVQR